MLQGLREKGRLLLLLEEEAHRVTLAEGHAVCDILDAPETVFLLITILIILI